MHNIQELTVYCYEDAPIRVAQMVDSHLFKLYLENVGFTDLFFLLHLFIVS